MLEAAFVLEGDRVCEGVRVPDREDVTDAFARVGLAVLVLLAVGVGDDVIFDVPVPDTLTVLEKDDVIDDEAPRE